MNNKVVTSCDTWRIDDKDDVGEQIIVLIPSTCVEVPSTIIIIVVGGSAGAGAALGTRTHAHTLTPVPNQLSNSHGLSSTIFIQLLLEEGEYGRHWQFSCLSCD